MMYYLFLYDKKLMEYFKSILLLCGKKSTKTNPAHLSTPVLYTHSSVIYGSDNHILQPNKLL